MRSDPFIRLVPVVIVFMLATGGLSMLAASDDAPGEGPAVSVRTAHDLTPDAMGEMLIHPGGYRYLSLDPAAGTVTEQRLPESSDVLSAGVNDAVARCPSWMKEDLEAKFLELEQRNMPLGTNDIADISDCDGDGDLDIVIGEGNGPGLRYLDNLGTRYQGYWKEDPGYFAGISLPNSSLISPDLYDTDGDGDADLVLGLSNGTLSFFENTGSTLDPVWTPRSEGYSAISVIGDAVPRFADMNDDGVVDLFIGSSDGTVKLYNGVPNAPTTTFVDNSWMLMGIVTSGGSRPWPIDMNADGELDLAVGDNAGVLHYYKNTGTGMQPIWGADDLTAFAGTHGDLPVSFALGDLDGDTLIDLVLSSNAHARQYTNIGTGTVPRWLVFNSYEAYPGYEYYPSVRYLQETGVWPAVDALAGLLRDCELRFTDEIGFQIAHTSRGVIMQQAGSEDFPSLYKDNAYFIYENDKALDYVKVVDVLSGDDRYTTVVYDIGTPTGVVQETLPRDIYYWNIVHFKVTEELPAYIDPETGDPAPKASGGVFWRDYLFNHADDAYPPDPSSGVEYPKSEPPPLLSEKAGAADTFYDRVPYTSPGGYDNTGLNNRRPWGYRSHAIEAVSNWVAKTLPLNQQEVDDSERPTQPVRIAHGHNGNCGELQDLTISAARSCLIPAQGVLMTAEDHVWSEFWLQGWHQWDNYWSDGGSVIDNFYTYWSWWSGGWHSPTHRAGSGLYSYRGDEEIQDVTDDFIPPFWRSKTTIRVVDRLGHPVDGARVVILSHWMMEHQTDSPVTVPMPSLWNYTDMKGECEFHGAGENFTFKVVSKVGNGVWTKTFIDPGSTNVFTIQLDGVKWSRRGSVTGVDRNYPGTARGSSLALVELDVTDGFQEPPDPQSGDLHPHAIDGALSMGSWALSGGADAVDGWGGGEHVSGYAYDDEGTSRDMVLDTSDMDSPTVVMEAHDSLETSMKVRYRVTYLPHDIGPDQPTVWAKLTYPRDDDTFEWGDGINIRGVAVNYSSTPLDRVQIRLCDGGVWNEATLTTRGFVTWFNYTWDQIEQPCTGGGRYTLMIRASDVNGNESYDSITVDVLDTTSPWMQFDDPVDSSAVMLGGTVNMKVRVKDMGTVETAYTTVDGVQRDISAYISGTAPAWSLNYPLDTSGLSAGSHKITLAVRDECGNWGTKMMNLALLSGDPLIEIDEPTDMDRVQVGRNVSISGRISDDGSIAAFDLDIILESGSYTYHQDLMEHTQGDMFTTVWSTEALSPGTYRFTFNATDELGHVSTSTLRLFLVSQNDTTAPFVQIESPGSGESIDEGEPLEITGTAMDENGMGSLTLSIFREKILVDTVDLLSTLDANSRFRYTWDTGTSGAGSYLFSVDGKDPAGNKASDTVDITVRGSGTAGDLHSPTVIITSPDSGSVFVYGGQVDVRGSLSDDTGVISLTVSWDGRLTQQPVSFTDPLDGTFEFWLNSTLLPFSARSSIFVLEFTATDGAGRSSTDTVTISLIEEQAPGANLIFVDAEGKQVTEIEQGGVVYLNGTVSDDTSLDKLLMSHDGGTEEVVDSYAPNTGSAPVSYLMDTRSLSPGTHSFSFTLIDSFGNRQNTTLTLTLTGENGGGGRNDAGVNWVGFFVALLIIAIVIFALAYLTVIFRGPRGPPEQPEKEEDERRVRAGKGIRGQARERRKKSDG